MHMVQWEKHLDKTAVINFDIVCQWNETRAKWGVVSLSYMMCNLKLGGPHLRYPKYQARTGKS